MEGKIYNIQEAMIDMVRQDRVWEEKVYISDGYLVLNIRFPYEIELTRIDTEKKLLGWIVHLLEKNWVSREMLLRMVDVWQHHFKQTIELSV